jgi:SWI/SNF-related matrix-associated actin-dependent regulator of chromatin subfamily A3
MDDPDCFVHAYAPGNAQFYNMSIVVRVFALEEKVNWAKQKLNRFLGSNLNSERVGASVTIRGNERSLMEEELEKLFGDMKARLQAIRPIQPPSALATELMAHQKLGLSWMMEQEMTDPDSLPPLWEEKTEKNKTVYYNEVSCSSTTEKPPALRGGILADDMGLGKTIQCLALCLAHPPEGITFSPGQRSSDVDVVIDPSSLESAEKVVVDLTSNFNLPEGRGSTLIITPASVVSNWIEQIHNHIVADTVSIGFYHGSERKSESLACDFVITSYGTISSEFKQSEQGTTANKKKSSKSGKTQPHSMEWHRIILDEAHIIRNTRTQMFKSVTALKGTHRWALSGTPVQNSADDCQALFSFLKLEPFNRHHVFKQQISAPIKNNELVGVNRLRTALASSLIRRTKDELPELNLPEKTVEICELTMDDEAREKYDTLHKAYKAVFNLLSEHDAVLKNYSGILEIILRLRQLCNSERLVPIARLEAANEVLRIVEAKPGKQMFSLEEAEELLELLRKSIATATDSTTPSDEGPVECSICLELASEDTARILRTCKHTFCAPCMNDWQKASAVRNIPCPLCRQSFQLSDVVDFSSLQVATAAAASANKEKTTTKKENGKKNKRKRQEEPNKATRNVKIEYLVQLVNDLPSSEKIVVFSSFTAYLDIVTESLEHAGIQSTRIDGTMTIKARLDSQNRFSKYDGPQVLLVSLKAGGTGLNLTRASSVVLLDLWWNAEVDKQAIDRVHRIGQTRQVKVKILMMEKTIENKILLLQERKTAIAAGALGKQTSQERLQQLSSLLD